MNCPACGHPSSVVVDSRPSKGTIRRRRQCEKCRQRWSTVEIEAGIRKRQGKRPENTKISGHPAVVLFFQEKQRLDVSYETIGKLTGMSSRTFMCWHKSDPRISNVEAALNVLGYELRVVKRRQ